MSRNIYILLFTLVLGIFSGCDVNDPILVPEDITYVAFSKAEISLVENSGSTSIELYLTTLSRESAQFTIAANTEGLSNPATEGTDFSLSNNGAVTFSEGFGYTTISLDIVDNDVFTGAKQFWLEITSGSAGYDLGIDGKHKLLVTIQDNEHPLKALLGRYRVFAANYWGSTWDLDNEQVRFLPDPDNLSNILIYDVDFDPSPALSHPLVGMVNETEHTITIKPQRWSDSKTNGYYFGFNLGNTDGIAAGNNPRPIEDAMVLSYTISGSDVTVTGFDNWGVKWMDPQGEYDGWWWWDYYTTGTFTKLEDF